jgi:iron complex transport system ATP-binding protein
LSLVLTERVEGSLLTVGELVALGRQPHTGWTGRLGPADRVAVTDAMRAVGADALASRRVAELSDGERQKAMLARALAQEPRVMILDEITAFLDLPRRVEIMGILAALAHDSGRAILLSTHDLDLALHTADRLWLAAGDGRVLEGAPEELVLAGAFETAFVSEHVRFDPRGGGFRAARAPHGVAAVTGDGLHALWTRRALERLGYGVVPTASAGDVHVAVVSSASGTEWRVSHTCGRQATWPSLGELIADLQVKDDDRAGA